MKRISKTAAALTAGGALALGGIAVAAPVLAGPGGPGGTGGTSGRPAAQSQTFAPRGHGYGSGPARAARPGTAGTGICRSLPASGTVTAAQKTALARAAEEEKLAHDLYAAFAARYDARVFDQVTAAETNHLAAVRTLLGRYEVADPTASRGAGRFASAGVQATYDRLLAQGRTSEQAALQIGVTMEKAQIALLQKARQGVTAKDVLQVYDRLITTSQRHLTAFQAWAA